MWEHIDLKENDQIDCFKLNLFFSPQNALFAVNFCIFSL